MRKFVFSTVMAAMLLSGANLALATGGHGGGGGSTGGGSTGGGSTGGGSAGPEKDGSPGADGDAAAAAERSANSAALAECERLEEERRIGQSGPTSGTETSLAGRDCDMPIRGSAN